MSTRKAYDIENLTDNEKARLDLSQNKKQYNGTAGKHLLEPYILPEKAVHEVRLAGTNGQLISLIRDTPGDIGSGLSARTGTGAIELVAGFSSADPSRTTVENPQISRQPVVLSGVRNYKDDAARLLISQKTNVDDNFELVNGNIGSVRHKSAISMKADSIRVIAREGVKIVSGVTEDENNSRGDKVRSVPRINFIAGNNDATLEPVVKARMLEQVIKDVYEQINALNSTLDTFMTAQIEFNSIVQSHTHTSPALVGVGAMGGVVINGFQVIPSQPLLAAGQKLNAITMVSKIDSVYGKLQAGITDFNSSNVFGPKNPASPSVYTT